MAKISPEEMAVYRQTARVREARRKQQLVERQQRAWHAVRQAADLLKKDFGASRVILFGSLVCTSAFHERSDIDLAVTGIPARIFFKAWSALDHLEGGFEFDLVDLETAKAWVHEAVATWGIEL